MANIIQIRRDTATNWQSANPILAEGEQGWEKDTRKRKTGDGSTPWDDLPYDSSGGDSSGGHDIKFASYTLAVGDKGKTIIMDVATANNVIVPLNTTAAILIDTEINIFQYGVGETTIVPEVGVVIRSAGTRYRIYEQYSLCTLKKIDTNEWLLIGDLKL